MIIYSNGWRKKTNKPTQDFYKLINYKNIRDAAWLFLINNDVSRLPLDIEQISRQNDWILLLFEDNIEVATALNNGNANMDCDGLTCIYKNKIFIIYKRFNNIGRWRFTMAHEFGHITLLHLDKLANNQYEREANMFAARVLMPMCVIKECGAYTPAAISNLCGVSLTAATYRAERLQMLLARQKFYTSPYEVKVLRQFKKFIKQNRRS